MLQSSGESVELVVIARNGSHRERVTSLSPAHVYTSPRWSPDDRSIAIQRLNPSGFDVALEIIQVGGGERREVTRSERLRGFSWLPDGSGLVCSSSRGSTILYPPVFNLRVVGRDGRGDRQVTFGDLSYVEPDVHQSGKLLASRIRSQSDVWRFPIAGSATENTRDAVRITRQTGQAQTPSISPTAPRSCISPTTAATATSGSPGRMDRACARSPTSAIQTSSSVFRCGRPPETGSCSSWCRAASVRCGRSVPTAAGCMRSSHAVVGPPAGRATAGGCTTRQNRTASRVSQKFLPRAARPWWSDPTPP